MRILIFLLTLTCSIYAYARLEKIPSEKALYEFGLVGGAGYVPDYPASDQGRIRYIGAPIVRYRGLRFRSDEEDSMKARLFTDPHYGFDLSAAGSFPTNSDKNDARKGMRDLDWIGELGPRFYFFLIKTEKVWVRFFTPVRLAFSTDLTGATYRGLVFAPSFNIRYYFDETKFNSIIFGATRTHTTHHLQEYFFQVDEKYSNADRPQYNAESGYLSTSAGMAFIHEKKNIGFYTGFGVNSFKGAANAGSPLHRTDYTYGMFVGMSYIFHQSDERGFQ